MSILKIGQKVKVVGNTNEKKSYLGKVGRVSRVLMSFLWIDIPGEGLLAFQPEELERVK